MVLVIYSSTEQIAAMPFGSEELLSQFLVQNHF